MANHPVRKLLGLTVLYCFIILGIFALQFRNQTVFSIPFGDLRLLLSETKKEGTYSDSFQISYKGITFFTDKYNRVQYTTKSGAQNTVSFTGWEKLSGTEFRLDFSNSTSLICRMTGPAHDVFTAEIKMPASVSHISIPFKITGSYTLTDLTSTRAVLRTKDKGTVLSAPALSSNRIDFYTTGSLARYADFVAAESFTFAQTKNNPLSRKDAYETILKQFRSSLVSSFMQNAEQPHESYAAAYIAEMSLSGKYTEAVNNIPASFRSSTRRTYLTAPALNSLPQMNKSLLMNEENMLFKLQHALDKSSIDIFETDNIVQLLDRQSETTAVKTLSIPASIKEFSPSILQAAGILSAYSAYSVKEKKYAELLKSAVPACLAVIEKACTLTNGKLVITQNDAELSLYDAVKTGSALVSYGQAVQDQSITQTGYMMINSRMQNSTDIDMFTAGRLYGLLCAGNTYYPHEVLLEKKGTNAVWAWTIAQSVELSRDSSNSIIITASFPVGSSHYMIINGIEPFYDIEIYGLSFRTDPRFETYNSSGYIYDAASKSLLLKYRHRSPNEVIKLNYTKPQLSEQPQPNSDSSNSSLSNQDKAEPVTEADEAAE